MALLFLDIESTGLLRKEIDLWDPAQPRAVKFAAEHADESGRTFNRVDLTIRPEGAAMKPGALKVHGVDGRAAQRHGLRDNIALGFLAEIIQDVNAVFTFSDFDVRMVAAMMYRLEINLGKPRGTYANRWLRPRLTFVNVQHPAAQSACKIPSKFESGEYQWPSLDDACEKVLGEPRREGVHDAWDDLSRLKRLTFELARRGHFPMELPIKTV